MKNERGIVTLDYLFAFVLVGGFSFLLLALSVSLSTVEIAQYMTFASARNFYAGHVSPQTQQDAAFDKFNELMKNPVIAPLFKSGWFEFQKGTLTIGSITQKNPDFAQYRQEDQNNLFHGTVVYLVMNVLDFKVPFFGSTTRINQSGTGKQGYGAYVGSYLGRETTYMECENFMKMRFPAIKKLQNDKGADQFSRANAKYLYVPTDNGC